MTTLLTGPSLPPAAGGRPKALVVLLHGLGADGADLIGLGHAWAAELAGTAFVAPDAPYPCDFAPSGRQWFSMREIDQGAILAALAEVAPSLDRFIDAELERLDLSAKDLALVGFSQGAMLALHAGLRRTQSPAAIIAYSGCLVGPERLADELRGRPPVLLVHGDRDEVVEPQFMPASEAALKAAGVPVNALWRPGLGHGIDEAGMRAGLAQLKRALPGGGGP